MASAYLEYGSVAAQKADGLQAANGQTLGKCVAIETLTISASPANGAVAGTATKNVVRITAGAAIFVAIGTTPDTSAAVATAATQARRYMASGSSLVLALGAGELVSVLTAP